MIPRMPNKQYTVPYCIGN